MRKANVVCMVVALLYASTFIQAQNEHSVTIENISSEAVWPAVIKAFADLSYPRPLINKREGTAYTSYYRYKTMLFDNRVKFALEYKTGTLNISISERQYLSDKGWVENVLPASDKQMLKLLNPVKEQLLKLTEGQPYTGPAAGIRSEDHGNKAGLYDNFALVKTNNKAMDLLGVHENGNIIGIDLDEDQKRISSLTFKISEDAPAAVMLYNENGTPQSMMAGGYAMHFSSIRNGVTRVTVFDTLGRFISSHEVQLTAPLENTEILPGTGDGGPSLLNPIPLDFSMKDLADYTGYASTALNAVACIASLPTAVGAIVPCGVLALDVLSRVVPEDAFIYNELQLANTLFAYVTFKNPVKTLEKAITLAGGLKDATASAAEWLERHFPPGEIIIAGNPEVKVGDFGEMGEPVLFYALSNYPEVPVVWGTSSDAIKIIPVREGEAAYRPGYSTVQIYALQPDESGEVTITASQMKSGELIQGSQKIFVESPGYYYMPDCQQLFDLKVISAAEFARCESDAEACEDALNAAGDHILVNDPEIVATIIREHLIAASEITDPDMRLQTEKLNFSRKIWKEDGSTWPPSEAGEFRDFVSQAPCMYKWFSYGDRQTIIALAHEGMLKIEAIEKKVEGLQKAANESNFQKIGAEIMKLEESIPEIKETYEAKIKKVAEKQTIRYETRKSDPEKYYTIQYAVVTGARWGKYDGTPNLLLDIFFTPQKATKTQQFFDETRTYDLFLTQFSFSFINGSDDPVQYALIIGDQIRQKGVVQTAIRMKIFEDEIQYLDFYRSNAGAKLIE
ncbi:MAG: hypothetical protein RBR28_04520 [Lentimicrobium sp.]|nr:hypothetical protein [Lentimicrobium sp.]